MGSKKMIKLEHVMCLVVLVLSQLPPALANGGIISVSWDSDNSAVHSIDESTGAGTFIGFAGIGSLNSLARNSLGEYYSVGGRRNNVLVTIDVLTGMASPVAILNMGDIRDLAFSQTDELYGIFSDGPNALVKIDSRSGLVTSVGSTGFFGIQAIALAPNGELYGWDCGSGSGIGSGLVAIDVLSGAAVDVNPLVNGTSDQVQGMTFSADGTLLGARSSLFKIDISSGVLSPVGAGGYEDVRGIAFSAQAVPEPGSFVCVSLLGIAAMFVHRRRLS